MSVEINKVDLYKAWDMAEELVTSFRELSDDDLILCKDALLNRAKIIRDTLGYYVEEDDIIEK